MVNIRNSVVVTVLIGVGIFLGYVKGYYSGFDDGMTVGEVRELVNQGYTVEDAFEIAEKRREMAVTSQELFKRNR